MALTASPVALPQLPNPTRSAWWRGLSSSLLRPVGGASGIFASPGASPTVFHPRYTRISAAAAGRTRMGAALQGQRRQRQAQTLTPEDSSAQQRPSAGSTAAMASPFAGVPSMLLFGGDMAGDAAAEPASTACVKVALSRSDTAAVAAASPAMRERIEAAIRAARDGEEGAGGVSRADGGSRPVEVVVVPAAAGAIHADTARDLVGFLIAAHDGRLRRREWRPCDWRSIADLAALAGLVDVGKAILSEYFTHKEQKAATRKATHADEASAKGSAARDGGDVAAEADTLEAALAQAKRIATGGAGGTAARRGSGGAEVEGLSKALADDVLARKLDGAAEVRAWVVRHGERVDETEEARVWYDTIDPERWFDPPLTEAGREQARRAARRLADTHERVGFEAIYVSPLLRTLQTAEEMAKLLKLKVVVVPGLCECAAAVRRRGLRAMPLLLTEEEIRHECPDIADLTILPLHPETYQPTLESLCSTGGARDVLVVTHREGIRDLIRLIEGRGKRRARTPYCCVAVFGYERARRRADGWRLVRYPD